MRVTIENTKKPDQVVVVEFSANDEDDVGRYVKAAGDNFRMDHPNVPFDDKLIKLEKA